MHGYRPEFFELYELLPRDFYTENVSHYGHRLWMVFDPGLLNDMDAIRRRYGKMVANTWWWGGEHQYRGYRPPVCEVGAKMSMHRFGRAADLVPVACTAEDIREDMRAGRFSPSYITRVESAVAWLHADTGNILYAHPVVFFNP